MNNAVSINQGGGFPFGLKDRGLTNSLGTYTPVSVNEAPVAGVNATMNNAMYWNFSRAVGNGESMPVSYLSKINSPEMKLAWASTRGNRRQDLKGQMVGENLSTVLGQTAPSDKMNSLGAEGLPLPDSGNEFV